MVRIDRIRLEYTNRSKKFTLTADDKQNAFERQYNHIYVARLQALKPRILDAGKKQIGLKSNFYNLGEIVQK